MCFKLSLSRDAQRDVSIEMETEEDWEAVSLNPNQPLITQKVLHSFRENHRASHKRVMIRWLEAHHVAFVPTGDRWCLRMPALDQGAEPLLLPAADESRPLSVFLPGVLARNPRAHAHVPLWCPVAGSRWKPLRFCTFCTARRDRHVQLQRPPGSKQCSHVRVNDITDKSDIISSKVAQMNSVRDVMSFLFI